jgi:peptide/nickel transport system substrate-binding protein
MKRNFLFIAFLCLTLMLFTSFSLAQIKNPDTIIYATIGGPESMDPHWGYDTASGEVVYEMYDNLIDYKGKSTAEFVPMLATEVPSVENGLISEDGLTYTFPIRKEVKFHNGDILTPEDVVYSIKRALIFDRSGGPTWMFCEPLLGVYGIEDKVVEVYGLENYSDLFVDGDPRGELKPEKKYKEAMIKFFNDYIDKTVEVDGDKVIFHLAQAYAPFINILAHSGNWSAIIDKKWAIAQGAWDGQADNWWKYHDPEAEKDPLYAVENGTGPFVLQKWVPEEVIMLERFDDYWQGPAKIKNVQIKYISEFTTRKLMLQNGDADIIYVPLQYLSEVEKMEGVIVEKNLPQLANTVCMFPWTINAEGNSYIGSGKLDGEGIPPDFFSDIHVRKGFSYLFPYDIFIERVAKGMAIRNPGPIVKGVPGYTADAALFYPFSLEKAAEEFKLAWDGQLWEKGCKFNIFYNEGNAVRKAASDILSTYAKMLNPKFNLEPVGIQWSAYLKAFLTEKLPIFTIGWQADYPDPHNWAPTYMGSHGDYASFFGEAYREFARENVDPLLKEGLQETDPVKRIEIYKKLTQIAHDQAISIYAYQPGGSHVQRLYINGWYFNPIIPGLPEGADFYNLSKGE